MLQTEVKFSPDICERFEQYSRHTTYKHKTINEFVSILKEICDLEQFYSRNLEKLAQSTSKLIMGKDTLKGIFIVFERLLSTLSQQAKNVAENIKSDMMPYVKMLVNEENFKYLEQGKHVKDIYIEMQKKFKALQFYKRNYVNAYNNWSINGSLSPPPVKQQLKIKLINAEKQLTSNIQHYNQAVDVYILNVSELTSMFCQAETNRKKDLKSAIQKDLIYQVDRIKNVQYNIGNYCKNLDALEDKIFINQKTANENSRIPLVKVSSANYIQFLKDGVMDHAIISQRQNVVDQLQKRFQGEINQEEYNYALKQLYSAMDYSLQTKNFEMLQQIVDFSSSVYKVLPEFQGQRSAISLKQGIFCHDIFCDEGFWKQYTDHVISVIQRQNGSLGSCDVEQQSLQEALRFIESVKINESILRNIMCRLKCQLSNLNIELRLAPEVKVGDPPSSEEVIGLEDVNKNGGKRDDEEDKSDEYTKQEYQAFS